MDPMHSASKSLSTCLFLETQHPSINDFESQLEELEQELSVYMSPVKQTPSLLSLVTLDKDISDDDDFSGEGEDHCELQVYLQSPRFKLEASPANYKSIALNSVGPCAEDEVTGSSNGTYLQSAFVANLDAALVATSPAHLYTSPSASPSRSRNSSSPSRISPSRIHTDLLRPPPLKLHFPMSPVSQLTTPSTRQLVSPLRHCRVHEDYASWYRGERLTDQGIQRWYYDAIAMQDNTSIQTRMRNMGSGDNSPSGVAMCVHVIECILRPDIGIKAIMGAVAEVADCSGMRWENVDVKHLLAYCDTTEVTTTTTATNSDVVGSVSSTEKYSTSATTTSVSRRRCFDQPPPLGHKNTEWDMVDFQVCISHEVKKDINNRVLLVQFLQHKHPSCSIDAHIEGVKTLNQLPHTAKFVHTLQKVFSANVLSFNCLNGVDSEGLSRQMDPHFITQLVGYCKQESRGRQMEGDETFEKQRSAACEQCNTLLDALLPYYRNNAIAVPRFPVQSTRVPSFTEDKTFSSSTEMDTQMVRVLSLSDYCPPDLSNNEFMDLDPITACRVSLVKYWDHYRNRCQVSCDNKGRLKAMHNTNVLRTYALYQSTLMTTLLRHSSSLISQGTKDIQHIFADDIIKSPSVCPLVRRSSRRLTDLSLSDELSVLSEPSDDLEDLSHLEECIKMDIGSNSDDGGDDDGRDAGCVVAGSGWKHVRKVLCPHSGYSPVCRPHTLPGEDDPAIVWCRCEVLQQPGALYVTANTVYVTYGYTNACVKDDTDDEMSQSEFPIKEKYAISSLTRLHIVTRRPRMSRTTGIRTTDESTGRVGQTTGLVDESRKGQSLLLQFLPDVADGNVADGGDEMFDGECTCNTKNSTTHSTNCHKDRQKDRQKDRFALRRDPKNRSICEKRNAKPYKTLVVTPLSMNLDVTHLKAVLMQCQRMLA